MKEKGQLLVDHTCKTQKRGHSSLSARFVSQRRITETISQKMSVSEGLDVLLAKATLEEESKDQLYKFIYGAKLP